MRLRLLMSLVLLLCLFIHPLFGQENQSVLDRMAGLPTRFLGKLSHKVANLEERIIVNTERTLRRLERQEQKLKRKLAKKDSLAATQIFGDIEAKYRELRTLLSPKKQTNCPTNFYIPVFDTLKTSIHFIFQNANRQLNNPQQITHLRDAMKNINTLDEKLQGAESIRKYLRESRVQLKDQLNRFGLSKELTRYNKQAYYYSQQIKEYQDVLKDPSKLERKAIEWISKIPAFQKFFTEHSQLSQLFPSTGNAGTAPAIAGLQTRSDIQQLIQSRFGPGSPDLNQAMGQNMQQAGGALNQLKDRIGQAGGSNGDFEIPEFKNPNSQRTKSFWKRWEVQTNFQSSRGNNYLPKMTDFGLSFGFRINDKSTVGVGTSYKMGWGNNLRRITLTHEGLGLRSFLDLKLKRGLFVSGGYEQNFIARFNNIEQLKNEPSNWKQSMLLGFGKKYKISRNFKGDIRLLFDFLYNKHWPQTQPVIVRIGYGLTK